MIKKIFLASLAFAAVAGPAVVAAAQPPVAAERQASIPFFHHRQLTSFTPIDNDTVYLRAAGRWYRAELLTPCFDLPWANAIAVDTGASGSLDNFSTLIVGRERCRLQSLVASEAPPRRQRRRR